MSRATVEARLKRATVIFWVSIALSAFMGLWNLAVYLTRGQDLGWAIAFLVMATVAAAIKLWPLEDR